MNEEADPTKAGEHRGPLGGVEFFIPDAYEPLKGDLTFSIEREPDGSIAVICVRATEVGRDNTIVITMTSNDFRKLVVWIEVQAGTGQSSQSNYVRADVDRCLVLRAPYQRNDIVKATTKLDPSSAADPGMRQQVPAASRRWHHMRRAAIALGILETA